MADKGEATIIIKKIKKGGHGGHGGAWKVAYADFVTAMMAFFLVMWLMGSDEDTKAAVSHYFNNPTSAWRKDLVNKDNSPLGDLTGAGENVVAGSGGQTPDDLIERPARPMQTHDIESAKAGDVLEQFLSDDALMSLDMIRFSVPEDLIFRAGTTDQWADGGERFLKKLGVLARKYRGKLQVRGTFAEGGSPTSGYEFKMSRAVAIARYAVDRNWIREEQITTFVTESKRAPASAEDEGEGSARPRIEFTLIRAPRD